VRLGSCRTILAVKRPGRWDAGAVRTAGPPIFGPGILECADCRGYWLALWILNGCSRPARLRRRPGAGIGVRFGVGIGIVAALGSTRALGSLLFGVDAIDLVTFAGMSAVLVMVGLVASYMPARRASSVDPIESLRGE